MAVLVRRKESGWVRVVDRIDEKMGTVEYSLDRLNEKEKEEVRRFEAGMGHRL